ncbi:MAG TPA: hypothetical protein DDX91_09385 [Ruminococcaceae bacterium]|nr:hypothetical protein [Oscillospiraceae bacterium]
MEYVRIIEKNRYKISLVEKKKLHRFNYCSPDRFPKLLCAEGLSKNGEEGRRNMRIFQEFPTKHFDTREAEIVRGAI